MQEIWKFLVENWQIIASILFGVIEFILFVILKRKPVVYDSSIYKDLVDLVTEAESKFPESGSGEQKLNYVVTNFLATHKFQNKDLNWITNLVVKPIVEKILSTPSKK